MKKQVLIDSGMFCLKLLDRKRERINDHYSAWTIGEILAVPVIPDDVRRR
jgi:hypothetical protein